MSEHLPRHGALLVLLTLAACATDESGSISAEDVLARVSETERAFSPASGGFTAAIPARGLVAHFDAAESRLGDDLALRFEGWGRDGTLRPVAPVAPTLGDCVDDRLDTDGACVRRLEYPREGVTEWWTTTPTGFEQGFTAAMAPAGDGPLHLRLGVDGVARRTADGAAVRTPTGADWTVTALRATDATGRELPARFDVEQGALTIVVDDAGATWPVTVDPLYTTATTTFSGTSTSQLFGLALSAGDVDGDGHQDLVIGSPGYSSNTGRVYVYAGTGTGYSTTPNTTLTGSTAGDTFGAAVSATGDVNDDGYDDVAVGAPAASSVKGQVSIYHGSITGLSTTAARTLTGSTALDTCGYSVSIVGDYNADGYDDLAYGCPNPTTSTAAGKFFAYKGTSTGIGATSDFNTSGSSGYHTGSAIAGGDVNGDGVTDVAVTAPGYSTNAGRIYVYRGLAGSTLAGGTRRDTVSNTTAGDNAGTSVALADVDGDGFDELIVGGPYASSSLGTVWVYPGTSAGITATAPSGATATLTGTATGGHFGAALANVGDLDGDSYDDVLVGAPDASSSTGAAYLYAGSAAGLTTTVTTTLTGSSSGELFGFAVTGVGDATGDGFGDVVIGAPGNTSSTGVARLYTGTSSDADHDGYSTDTDCDDTRADVHPGATETCDGVDDDCDGLTDDADPDVTGTSTWYADSDSDTYGGTTSVTACTAPSGYVASSTDCNDSAGGIHPGATEFCDGVDDDCDGLTDDADSSVVGALTWYADSDGDSFGGTTSITACTVPSGYVAAPTDCDDGASAVHPGATETCDGVDDDCDGLTDDADTSVTGTSTWYADSDGDTYGGTSSVAACTAPSGYVATATDCDDGASTIHPGATETCDGVDDDCDGLTDDADSSVTGTTTFYHDVDNDGYAGSTTGAYCSAPSGWYASATDCDDSHPTAHPGAAELCDGLDNDCDGLVDSSDPDVTGSGAWYADTDGDGYGAGTVLTTCTAPSGYVTDHTDCDDTKSAIHPGASETCDGVDNDCDTLVDDSDPSVTGRGTWYRDADGDGYGSTTTTTACSMPSGYVATATDCDDTRTGVHPGASETCDGLDDDCDGLTDDADGSVTGTTTYYYDSDHDGYAGTTSGGYCSAPAGWYTTASDCDDATSTIHPGATETCDGADDDCDGLTDDADTSVSGTTTYYHDVDSDGYAGSTTGAYCSAPSGWYTTSTDCDDTKSAIHPGASEVCDGSDNDCDGLTDDADSSVTGTTTWYHDLDADGYAGTTSGAYCSAPSGWFATSTDCDDTKSAIHPGATETCDGADDDCDGLTDDSDPSVTGTTTWYRDADADGYGGTSTAAFCTRPSGYLSTSTDCDDGDADVYPGATEVVGDGVDEDCDTKEVCYDDVDGDGWRTEDTTYGDVSCTGAALSSAPSGDCDDTDPAYNPGALEADCADPNDYNCDGSVGYADEDGDGAAACDDCDDGDPKIYPGANEVCDGVDDDCDGLIDDDDPSVDGSTYSAFYVDEDGDGHGGDLPAPACSLPDGAAEEADDCDDGDADVYPGANEVCDGVDDDCDSLVDDADPDLDAASRTTWYADADSDGYGGTTTTAACTAPSGYLATSTDCDDGKAGIHPGATETCDGVDDDCDGLIDDADGGVVATTLYYRDGDGDGYGGTTTTTACTTPTGYTATSTDCDDGNAAINPAGTEVCDSVDDDCDGLVDDADPSTTGKSTFYADTDGDGYGSDTTGSYCAAAAGWVADTTDCNDKDSGIHPGAAEVCDAADTDEDCDGVSDDADASATGQTAWYRDGDGDGYPGSTTALFCDEPTGYGTSATDCDDTSTAVHPGATETVGDGVDEDCNGSEVCYEDLDGDGWRTDLTVSGDVSCTGAALASAASGDCDDSDTAYHPGATEADCTDPNDYNCDGSVGYTDADGDHWAACEECDDGDAGVNPDATEVCDGVDDDCDTLVDDDDPDVDTSGFGTFYVDADSDGYGGATTTRACSEPTGATATSTDCDDADGSVHPGATEVCGGGDEDCDGATDAADPSLDVGSETTYYLDADSDGYGGDATTRACTAPSGYGTDTSDCDDADGAVSPGATEVCDGLDDDCDGLVDDADPGVDAGTYGTFYVDADGDGFGDPDSPVSACAGTDGVVADDTDCDDTDADVFPGGAEGVGDGVDGDCDGSELCYEDLDADGWRTDTVVEGDLACSTAALASAPADDCDDTDAAYHPSATEACDDPNDYNCDGSVGYTDGDGDGWAACEECDDGDAAVNPAATEVCDGVDDDCDGAVDGPTSADALPFYADADGDGWTDNSVSTVDCTAPLGYAAETTPEDCLDSDPSVYPGAAEVTDDGIDQDCDGADLSGGDTGDTGDTGTTDTDTGPVDTDTGPGDTDSGTVDTDTAGTDTDTGGTDTDTGPGDETGGNGGGSSSTDTDDTGKSDDGGCGCATTPSAPAAAGLGLLVAGLALGRRRR